MVWPAAYVSCSEDGSAVFAGVGGFRLGLEACGGRCVFASEIDAACRETYTLNFGAHGLGGDVCDVYAKDLPPFDLLTAGFFLLSALAHLFAVVVGPFDRFIWIYWRQLDLAFFWWRW